MYLSFSGVTGEHLCRLLWSRCVTAAGSATVSKGLGCVGSLSCRAVDLLTHSEESGRRDSMVTRLESPSTMVS